MLNTNKKENRIDLVKRLYKNYRIFVQRMFQFRLPVDITRPLSVKNASSLRVLFILDEQIIWKLIRYLHSL